MIEFKWTKQRPSEAGWYWFRVGPDSPTSMTPLMKAIVLVSPTGGIGKELINGTPICGHTGELLQCVFPKGIFNVAEMGGWFAGPIPYPAPLTLDSN